MERLSAFPGTAAGQRPTYNYVGKKVEHGFEESQDGSGKLIWKKRLTCVD